MGWFKRIREGITTSTSNKKETPEGLWHKCPACKHVMPSEDHVMNYYTCTHCGYHDRIGSEEYFSFLFDKGKYKELNKNLTTADPLEFEDTKKYSDRIAQMQKKTGLNEAIRVGQGEIDGEGAIIAAMDFRFIGGSMGSVVGEKIAKAIDHCLNKKLPLIIISRSGGARMMEAGHSLMQMAKTSAKLTELSDKGLPFISVLTDPTTGGVTASFAMLGDVHVAEPNALIGFAGPRVIKETMGSDLPEGFQRAEFLLEHGFIDMIVERKELKTRLSTLLGYLLEDR